MTPMTPTSSPGSLQIPVSRLSIVPAALIRGLGEAGIGGSKMEDVFARQVELECVGCGLRLTMAELLSLEQLSEADPNYAKLRRVRLGSCGRNTCTSQFYVLRIQPDIGTDVERLLQRVGEWVRDPAKLSADEGVPKAARPVNYNRRLGRFTLGILGALILLVLAWRWWEDGAYVPGISRPPQTFMTVADPALATEPASPTPAPKSPAKERVFEVK